MNHPLETFLEYKVNFMCEYLENFSQLCIYLWTGTCAIEVSDYVTSVFRWGIGLRLLELRHHLYMWFWEYLLKIMLQNEVSEEWLYYILFPTYV